MLNEKGLTVNVNFDEQKLTEIVRDNIKDYELQIKKIRVQAIKDFAEEHKKIMRDFLYNGSTDFLMKWCEYETNTDILVKEMTKDKMDGESK